MNRPRWTLTLRGEVVERHKQRWADPAIEGFLAWFAERHLDQGWHTFELTDGRRTYTWDVEVSYVAD